MNSPNVYKGQEPIRKTSAKTSILDLYTMIIKKFNEKKEHDNSLVDFFIKYSLDPK